MSTVHLHARVAPLDGPACPTVCGRPCDTVDTAYRDRDPERVTCLTCLSELHPVIVTSRTVEPGHRLTMSDRPLGTVTAVHRWEVDSARNAWSARVTFDDGRELTLTPGSALPLTVPAAVTP